jgi:3-isopropylmalate/(R)-2-methylmalate dehydratase small subunit
LISFCDFEMLPLNLSNQLYRYGYYTPSLGIRDATRGAITARLKDGISEGCYTSGMILYGTTHRVGDGITSAAIIAPEYQAEADPAWLAAHCLAGVDPSIAESAREGDVLLAGANFGAGPDAEIAVLALQAVGFASIICTAADADFVEAAEAYGLPVLICPAAVAAIAPGGVVRLDLAGGRITDRATGASYLVPPCAPTLVDTVRRAQLLTRMRRVVEEEGFEG